MRRVRKIVCSVVIGFVAFAAISCCCTQAVAKTLAASSAEHSCCPKQAKADPASHEVCPQCQNQLVQTQQVNFNLSSLLEKPSLFYAATKDVVQVAFSLPVLSVSLNGPPQGKQAPLYLQSHKLRL